MVLGSRASSALYCIYMLLPFVFVVAAVMMNYLHPLSLICLGAVIPAGKNFERASSYRMEGLEAMKDLDQASAQLQLIFSGLLSVGLFVAAFI